MNAIFFASGFAGLIYESIWTHYLKLFLGHAAYAQTLVLAIFMGGMAIGAALAARYATRIRNPLRTYAAIEAAIGVLAIVFHPIFLESTNGFYDMAFARHLGGIPFVAIKWGIATLLILPQTILLGATFPVFVSAATRQSPAGAGRSIATLYFANSLGGGVGVLISGFVLIPLAGLPGTVSTAGCVNLAIAALVTWMAKSRASPAPGVTEAGGARLGSTEKLLLAVAFLTGASSFIYEIGWIRMLSLVLGSATHSFELMLSSFILGLAFGGLWIRKRIDSASQPGVLLGYVQIAMGCAAIATIPLHNISFDLIAWTITNAPKTDGGYALFNLVRYGISSLIMFPAAFCAGMTLPLVTRILYANGHQGEKAIGLVYSVNTLGAITGLAFAVHIGMPVFGLNYLVGSGAVVDVLLGAILIAVFGGRSRIVHAIAAMVACLLGTAAAATTFNPQKMASGVFRSGKARTASSVLEIAHGRTATVSVEKSGASVIIRTNGKQDASAMTGSGPGYAMDEVTMTLIGTVPLMLHQAPRQVANIGFGSGITGETILADPRVQRMDSIEIEPRMVELAKYFTGLNRSVYDDPRSAIHIDDAKSFFASNGKTYDMIVSEPSNPWVSGVSGLFSVEFYRHVARYLKEDGIFAQWLQIYETHPDRVVSVLKAVDQAFDDYMVVALDFGDILLIAKPHGKVTMPENAYSAMSEKIKQKLWRIDIANQSDITFRIIGSKKLFKPWLDMRSVPANSDFAPYLDNNADHDRYIGNGWPDLYRIALSAYPIPEILGQRPALHTPSSISYNIQFGEQPPALAARLTKEILLGPTPGNESHPLPIDLPYSLASMGMQIVANCESPPLHDSPFAAAAIAIRVLPYISPEEGRRVLAAFDKAACLNNLHSTQSQWPVLLSQVANRDPKGFGATAEGLLLSGQGATGPRARYLLGMAMLGYIGNGEPERARMVWMNFSKTAFRDRPPGLEFEIMLAHMLAQSPTRYQ